MKKIFLILSLFLVQTCIVNAQQIISSNYVGKIDNSFVVAQLTLTGAGKNKSGGAPPPTCGGYIGPGDVLAGTTVYAYYANRAYSAATCGAPLWKVCQSASPTTCVDWSSSASTGAMVVTTVGGTDCTAALTNCAIDREYDISGANDCSGSPCPKIYVTRPNPAFGTTDCPGIVGPCINGGAITNITSTSAAGGTHAQPVTISVVYKQNVATRVSCIGYSNAAGTNYATGSLANTGVLYAGTASPYTIADSAWHSVQAYFSAGNSLININGGGDSATAAAGSAGFSGGYGTGFAVACPFDFQTMTESGFLGDTGASGSPAVRNALGANQKTFGGF